MFLEIFYWVTKITLLKSLVVPGHSPPSQSSPDSKSSTPSWHSVPSQAGEELSQDLALVIRQSPPQPGEDQAPHPPWTRSYIWVQINQLARAAALQLGPTNWKNDSDHFCSLCFFPLSFSDLYSSERMEPQIINFEKQRHPSVIYALIKMIYNKSDGLIMIRPEGATPQSFVGLGSGCGAADIW